MAEGSPQYDELKLRLEKAADGSYTVLASATDERVGRGSFVSPVTDDDLDDFVREVGLVRRGRRSQYERMDDIETLGAELFSALVRDQVADVYQAARTAAEDKGRGLRITLCLSGASELMRLPWKFLYRRPHFLSQSIYTPLVRFARSSKCPPPAAGRASASHPWDGEHPVWLPGAGCKR